MAKKAKSKPKSATKKTAKGKRATAKKSKRTTEPSDEKLKAYGARGEEVQFFMTDEDQREFVERVKDAGIKFARWPIGYPSRKVPLTDGIPENDWPTTCTNAGYLIYNSNCRDSQLNLRYKERLQEYKIVQPSTLVQFRRSEANPVVNTLENGRIATFLAYESFDTENRSHRTDFSDAYVKWWRGLKSMIRRNFTKCFILDPVTHKVKDHPIWAGPDAVRQYERGLALVADYHEEMTFHPVGVEVDEAKRRLEEYLARLEAGEEEAKRFRAQAIQRETAAADGPQRPRHP